VIGLEYAFLGTAHKDSNRRLVMVKFLIIQQSHWLLIGNVYVA
jgi:hypothetical protein